MTQLESLGCSDAFEYTPAGVDGLPDGPDTFWISYCPSVPTDSLIPWTVLSTCDSCTGEAPAGEVMIAWTGNTLCGSLPGNVCLSKSCLVTSPMASSTDGGL
jgi:hypothetical protein